MKKDNSSTEEYFSDHQENPDYEPLYQQNFLNFEEPQQKHAQEFDDLGEKAPEWCSPLFEKDLPPKRTKKRAEMLKRAGKLEGYEWQVATLPKWLKKEGPVAFL